MRVYQVTTCYDEEKKGKGFITGIKFSLRDPNDENGEVAELEMVGTEGDECDILTLEGPLDKI